MTVRGFEPFPAHVGWRPTGPTPPPSYREVKRSLDPRRSKDERTLSGWNDVAAACWALWVRGHGGKKPFLVRILDWLDRSDPESSNPSGGRGRAQLWYHAIAWEFDQWRRHAALCEREHQLAQNRRRKAELKEITRRIEEQTDRLEEDILRLEEEIGEGKVILEGEMPGQEHEKLDAWIQDLSEQAEREEVAIERRCQRWLGDRSKAFALLDSWLGLGGFHLSERERRRLNPYVDFWCWIRGGWWPEEVLKTGETFTHEDAALAVVEFGTLDTTSIGDDENGYVTLGPGNEAVAVSVRIENRGSTAHETSLPRWQLSDGLDHVYDSAYWSDEPESLEGPIRPGVTVRGEFRFEIPKGTAPLYLEYSSALDEVIARWKLR